MIYGLVILDVGIQQLLLCSTVQAISECQEPNLKKECSPMAYLLLYNAILGRER